MRCVLLAGEEGGPVSNKMGGIWNVINAEARNLKNIIKRKGKLAVLGPYYPSSGSDWNAGLNRMTKLKKTKPPQEFQPALEALEEKGIKAITGSEKGINYILFDTTTFETTQYQGATLTNFVKKEAYDLLGIDSLAYENTGYGAEYTHYLNLSYAISEFIQELLRESHNVSLHCHEFGTFYAIARLKKLGLPFKSIATFHATIPGRNWGHHVLRKIRENDSQLHPGSPLGLIKLESLASFADVVTFVGDSTRKESKLFYKIDGLVIRNGIEVKNELNWDKKNKNLKKIQNFLANNLFNTKDGKKLNPDKILPIFTISRIEIENKGYPDLLDALVLLDRIIRNHIQGGTLDPETRVFCFLITAHGPKDPTKLPSGFPLELPEEILVSEEHRLKNMINYHNLQPASLARGDRTVAALLYPQWLSSNDGGLNMTTDELMAGCIAGIFPSRYDPFLLTGLEAGKEGTPSIVSRVCGFSDALATIKRLVTGLGGIITVDNINNHPIETTIDYALAMNYFIHTYETDRVKYNLLCQEAYQLALQMNWKEPVKQYAEILL